MTILVVGKTGQLARAIAGQLESEKAVFLGREELDLSWPKSRLLAKLNAMATPSCLINSAAYTNVDLAEKEKDIANAINGEAPGAFAEYCKAQNIPLIHISTDYVFSGRARRPIQPDEATEPINAYGISKRLGEMRILSSGCLGVILRTSWVYDATGKNFMTTMLKLGKTMTEISVVDDQIGRPTYAAHLAAAVMRIAKLQIQKPQNMSVHHVSGGGDAVSWAGFASAIFNEFRSEGWDVRIKPITSLEFPTVAARPHYSVLNMDSLKSYLGSEMPNWRDGLKSARLDWLSAQQNPSLGA